MTTAGQKVIQQWYRKKKWTQFPFQQEMEAAYLDGYSGLLNAPTGSGKTYALFLPFLADYINRHTDWQQRKDNGLLMMWITPLRALTNDIRKAMQEACDEIGLPWKIATRTGDTSAAEKQALRKKLPEVLLTTPESLHLMLAQKEYPKIFKGLQVVVVDEWHELLGTKRGVQVELGLSRLKGLQIKNPTANLSTGEGASSVQPNPLSFEAGRGVSKDKPTNQANSLSFGEGRGEVLTPGEVIHGDDPTDPLSRLSFGEGRGEVVRDTKPRYYTTDATNWTINLDNAKRMLHKPTEAEELLWQLLRNKKTGYKFRRQHPVLDFIPDFICIEKKLIIEVDGGYHQDTEQKSSDSDRSGKLTEQGYRILRFSNEQVINHSERVVQSIKDHLNGDPTPTLPNGEGATINQSTSLSFGESRGEILPENKQSDKSNPLSFGDGRGEVILENKQSDKSNSLSFEEGRGEVLTQGEVIHEYDPTNQENSLSFGEGRGEVLHNITLRIWGISATIGNLEQAAEVLLGNAFPKDRIRMVRAHIEKKLDIRSVIPENVENYSWTGHIGVKLLPQVMEIVARSKTTLIFCNTRSQSEIWYHAILDNYPEYAGIMAMHHGSLDNELRNWVEQALHAEALKLVVCTSSLDLGVDFRPVDTVVQVGSPKGVARFMQRAGRSGHHPGAVSLAYFVPTHSLELLEGAALKEAIGRGIFESRDPMLLTMDVLIQYMVTLAVSEGFTPDELYREVKGTYAFADMSRQEYAQLLDFITRGGKTLAQYDEFLKVEIEDGVYKVKSRKVAMRHRLSIGTITSEVSIRVSWLSGGSLGTIEEGFISKLKPGDTFWFAGRSLEFVRIKDMTAFVKKSNAKKGLIPSWAGGRMPLSSQLSAVFRDKLDEVSHGLEKDIEVKALKPLFKLQNELSHLPQSNEFLIESFKSNEGHHLIFYPFEGRLVHEGMASILAYRITRVKPASFSIAMNDYGFELLADEDIPIEEVLADADFFSLDNLLDDIHSSLNSNEMARRKFRDIAHIGGLVFTGYPGQLMKNKHLQASTSLLFEVFSEYEPDNLLVRQAYNEALAFQLEEFRLRAALQRIAKQNIILKNIERPTPFAFPIMVDNLSRDRLTTESLEERVAKMARRYHLNDDEQEAKPKAPRRSGIRRKRGF